jgi:5-(carboxyamino)imidazole ribonucleotide mutase
VAESQVKPLVGIVMGSRSDLAIMQHAGLTLDSLQIPFEISVLSAHRTPDAVIQYAQSAEGRGLEVIIAGAGMAAQLPGVISALTILPVMGVPLAGGSINGLDALLSIVQMPGGVPVAAFAIGKAGAINAALKAAAILGNKYPDIRTRYRQFRQANTAKCLADTKVEWPPAQSA